MDPEKWAAVIVPIVAAVVSLWTLFVRSRDRREARDSAAASTAEAREAKASSEEAKSRVDYVKLAIEGQQRLNESLSGEIDRVRTRLEKEVEWLDSQLSESHRRHEVCEEHRQKDLERIHSLELLLAGSGIRPIPTTTVVPVVAVVEKKPELKVP